MPSEDMDFWFKFSNSNNEEFCQRICIQFTLQALLLASYICGTFTKIPLMGIFFFSRAKF